MPESLTRDLQSALSDCHAESDRLREALRRIGNLADDTLPDAELRSRMQDIADAVAEAESDD